MITNTKAAGPAMLRTDVTNSGRDIGADLRSLVGNQRLVPSAKTLVLIS